MQLLSERTEGYTGSDIAHVVSEALLLPVRELEAACHWLPVGAEQLRPCSPDQPGALLSSLWDLSPHQVWIRLREFVVVNSLQVCSRDVVANDILAAMATCGPSVTVEYLARFGAMH